MLNRALEKRFVLAITGSLPKEIYHEKANNNYRAGIPDVFLSGCKAPMWVEFKVIDVPLKLLGGEPRTYNLVGLTKLQRHWIEGRTLEGRDVGVCVGIKGSKQCLWYLGKDIVKQRDNEYIKMTINGPEMVTRETVVDVITEICGVRS